MKAKIPSGIFLALLSLAGADTGWAITLGLSPASQTITAGNPFDVDVVISGLHAPDPDEILSGYDINISYDASMLTATGVDFGSFLGGLSDSLQDPDFTTAGLFNIFEVSFLSDLDLDTLQGDSFTLATLHFTAKTAGTSALTITNADLTGFSDLSTTFPNPLTVDQYANSGVTVEPRTAVPEPASWALMGAGFIAGLAHKRRQRAARGQHFKNIG